MEWLACLIPFIIAAGGWFFRELHFRREKREKATADASQILKEKKALIEEQLTQINDDSQREALQIQVDEVNTALLGLHTERLRRTLKAAGLPPEEALIADGLRQLQPEQVNELKEDIKEVKSLPQSESIWDLLAIASAYYYAEQYQEAKETYDKILELQPNSPDSLLNRGNTYAKLERYDEALADYNSVLELRPDEPVTLMNRGITYARLERYDEALADYNHSLEIRLDDPRTLYNRGITYAKLERYDEALADYNHSLEIRPDEPDTLNNRGNTYAKLERYDEALADYNHVLKLRTEYPRALYNLACLLSLQEAPDEALNYLEKAIIQDSKFKEMAKTDKDFDNIRDDLRFKKLVGED